MRGILVILLLSLAAFACKKKEGPKGPSGPTTPSPIANKPTTPTPTPTPSTPSPAPNVPAPAAGPTDAQSVITGFFAAFNDGKLEQAVTFAANDYEEVNATSADQPTKGRAGLLESFQQARAAFSDLRFGARRIFDAGGVWVVQAVAHGTHTGELQGIKATGEKVGYEFLIWASVENGLLKRAAVYTPTLAILQQIKAVQGKAPPIPPWPEKPEVISGEGKQERVDAVAKVYAGFSQGSFAEAEAIAKPDIELISTADGERIRGIAEQKKNFEQERAAFPDAKFGVEVAIAVGDFVIVRGVMTGTNKGPLQGGIPATGKTVSVHFADIIKFEGDKAAVHESYSDPLEAVAALGLLQIGAGAPAKAPGADKATDKATDKKTK